MNFYTFIFGLLLAATSSCATTSPKQATPGDEKSTKTATLEAGAEVLQREAPIRRIAVYLVGFHPLKENPKLQMESHHYCNQVNEDFAQCILFDSNSKDARMNGIEYIISEKFFGMLPKAEQKYWHPHNYEILSGRLIAPGIPDAAEHELMRTKMNSYGKTWHVWNTGRHGEKGDFFPLGDPKLAWSFNRDGEVHPELLELRNKNFQVSAEELRKQRADLKSIAKPQEGENALRWK